MSHRTHIFTAVAACALALAATASNATTYDFSSVPQGTTATPTTINGATFSSSSDPGAFTFGPNGGLFSSLGPNVLSSAGVPATLNIAFSTAQTGLSFDAAMGDFQLTGVKLFARAVCDRETVEQLDKHPTMAIDVRIPSDDRQ
jgi:hypothetical protein